MVTPAGALADPAMRIGARAIDNFINLFVYFVFAFIVAVALGGGIFVSLVLTLLLIFGWEFGWLSAKQATPGKLLLGQKVIGENGSEITNEIAFIRAAVWTGPWILGALFWPLGFLGWLAVVGGSTVLLFTDKVKHQSVMDKLSKTVVVSTK